MGDTGWHETIEEVAMASGTEGFLVLSRSKHRDYVLAGGRHPILAISPTEAVSKYRGIEGDGWPIPTSDILLKGHLAGLDQVAAVLAYFRVVASQQSLCDVIYIDTSP